MKKITFLLVLLTVSTVTLSAQSIGMIGSFPASGWASDIVMNTTDNQNYTLSSYTFLDACEVKFRQGGAWTINWGDPNFPSGIGTQDGVNIPVPAGVFKINFNKTSGEYNFQNLQTQNNDSIYHWKSGVMIYKQSINTTDLDSISFRRPVAVGQFYQGGVIAYIFHVGDPGYIAGQTHGLIVATSNQKYETKWWNGKYTNTGATGGSIGTGSNNTNLIIASQGFGYYAAILCRNYNGGGYTDWYLPSKDELNKLYLNKSEIGGFLNSTYWSSTEAGINLAWCQNFNDGSTSYYSKPMSYAVRAVRSF